MKNALAQSLAKAAHKYLTEGLEHSENTTIYRQDYDDLMSIANMIENNEDSKAIARAMGKLDTLVRDVIPDKVYYNFIKM